MNDIHDLSRLGRLDLNLFRVFDTVYRERNLTRAAEVLFLSQSAVSHALARLREQLGDPLFVREGQGMTPTALAERLAPDVREALGLFRQAMHRSRDFDPARDILQFTLAMNDEIEPALLPALVQHLRATAPAIRIASVRLDRSTLKTDLASGRLDLAIDVAQPMPAELHHTVVMQDQFCVVSARRRRLTAASYLAAQHVTVSSRRTGLVVEDLVLSRLGHQRDIVLRCQHYETACRIVAETDLLLTLPRRQAESLNAAIGNHILAMPIDLPAIELHLYWHRQVDGEPGNQWLRSQLLSLATGAGTLSH